jgi:hypothetical protein
VGQHQARERGAGQADGSSRRCQTKPGQPQRHPQRSVGGGGHRGVRRRAGTGLGEMQRPGRHTLGSSSKHDGRRRAGRRTDGERGEQGCRQQHQPRQGNGQGVHQQRCRGRDAQAQSRQRCRRQQRRGRCAQPCTPATLQAGRRQHQCGRGCKRELGPGREECSRIERQHHAGGGGQRRSPTRGAPLDHFRGHGQQQQQRPPHRNAEPREQRLPQREPQGQRQCRAPGIQARRRPRPTCQAPPGYAEGETGAQRQVQAGHGEQVRDPQLRERAERGVRNAAALAQCQRRE